MVRLSETAKEELGILAHLNLAGRMQVQHADFQIIMMNILQYGADICGCDNCVARRKAEDEEDGNVDIKRGVG